MSKKYWTLRPTYYYTAKQLPGGGRNEIFWAAIGNIYNNSRLCCFVLGSCTQLECPSHLSIRRSNLAKGQRIELVLNDYRIKMAKYFIILCIMRKTKNQTI